MPWFQLPSKAALAAAIIAASPVHATEEMELSRGRHPARIFVDILVHQIDPEIQP